MFTPSLMASLLFLRGLFVINFVVGLTFSCVYAKSWRGGAFLRSPGARCKSHNKVGQRNRLAERISQDLSILLIWRSFQGAECVGCTLVVRDF